MTVKQPKTFWFDQMIRDCVAAFGWREDEAIHTAAKNIESVFTNLLKQEKE